jgi:hypothetical protein
LTPFIGWQAERNGVNGLRRENIGYENGRAGRRNQHV